MLELWSNLENSREEMEECRVPAHVLGLWSDAKFQRSKGCGWSQVGKTEFPITERVTENGVWADGQDVWIKGVYTRLELREKAKPFDIPSQSWPCLQGPSKTSDLPRRNGEEALIE